MISTLVLAAVIGLESDNLSMKFVPSSVTAKVGSYRPIRAEMNGTAELVKKAPEGIVSPKYGELKLGDKAWAFILDEHEGKPQRLFIDSNADGDLTNDPETKWQPRKSG